MNLDFNKNDDKMRLLISQMEQRLQKIYLGGGKSRLEKLKEQGKMSARERIDFLLDKNTPRTEIGAFAGYEMYAEHGGCPAGGVVVVIGYVSGKQCIVVANDATVKAGAWFPITGKKNLRAQEIAMENRLPIIYLVDSAGVYLPMQDEIFPDKEHFGRIFRNNAVYLYELKNQQMKTYKLSNRNSQNIIQSNNLPVSLNTFKVQLNLLSSGIYILKVKEDNEIILSEKINILVK